MNSRESVWKDEMSSGENKEDQKLGFALKNKKRENGIERESEAWTVKRQSEKKRWAAERTNKTKSYLRA